MPCTSSSFGEVTSASATSALVSDTRAIGDADVDDRRAAHEQLHGGGVASVMSAAAAAHGRSARRRYGRDLQGRRMRRAYAATARGIAPGREAFVPPKTATMRINVERRLVFMVSYSCRTTSCARLSPRMISTAGSGDGAGADAARGGRRRAAHSAPAARAIGADPIRAAGRMPGVGGRALVERVAQRELNLALGAGERQPLRLRRVDEQRHDAHRDRLAAVGVLLDLRARGQHQHVREDDLRRHVGRCCVGLTVATTSTRVPGST